MDCDTLPKSGIGLSTANVELPVSPEITLYHNPLYDNPEVIVG